MNRKHSLRGVLWTWAQVSIICLLVVFSAAATDANARFQDLGHKLICTCGCGQVLLECNHYGCPALTQMTGQLHDAIARGDTDAVILNAFQAKYGPTVFSSPIRGGFDWFAWIVPPAAILLAGLLAALLVRRWRRRDLLPANAASAAANDMDAMRARIRKDTEEL